MRKWRSNKRTNSPFSDLSARLGLNQDEGEKWIVNLIRDTRVDAKIDYKEGTVIMNHPPQSVYQQVIEKTKGAFFRTQVLRYAHPLATYLISFQLLTYFLSAPLSQNKHDLMSKTDLFSVT
jgi:translation initiation factor 3 subunit E